MSTLQVSTAQITTLSDGTNSTSCTNAIQGSAKAWVNFNGTGTIGTNQTIRASFNVSTVVKGGTGGYTINLINSMPDNNYSVAGLYAWSNEVAAPNISSISSSSFTVNQVRFTSGANAYTDSSICCYSIFR